MDLGVGLGGFSGFGGGFESGSSGFSGFWGGFSGLGGGFSQERYCQERWLRRWMLGPAWCSPRPRRRRATSAAPLRRKISRAESLESTYGATFPDNTFPDKIAASLPVFPPNLTNRPQIDPEPTPNRPQTDPKPIPNRPPNSTRNRSQTDPQPTPNRPKIDPKSTPDQLILCQERCCQERYPHL